MQGHGLTRIPEARLRQALAGAEAGGGQGGLRALPKADVHCHALLNAPLAAYEKVLGRELPRPPSGFADFSEFGDYLAVTGEVVVVNEVFDVGKLCGFLFK